MPTPKPHIVQATAAGPVDKQQKESLISMISIFYIEDQGILNDEQLSDAKASLRALFLRTTGEESMLRKLIDILKTNKALNQSFSDISSILSGITKSSEVIKRKIDTLKIQLNALDISVEEHADFVGPFLDFSAEFIHNVNHFDRLIHSYRDMCEREARYAHMFRIAKEARARLKDRLSGGLGDDGVRENEIRKKVINTFDYHETEVNLGYARRDAKNTLNDIESLLSNFKQMCQFAMNPTMRDRAKGYQPFRESRYPDVFTLFAEAQKRYARIEMIKEPIQELFRLYQHSYGLFTLDFQRFNKAIAPMSENSEAYFQAKDDDEDIRAKRNKLEKIEGVIAFLEAGLSLLKQEDNTGYAKFSSNVTDILTRPVSPWSKISEDLLRMKVAAEADLSTRLG
ncbi:MAG: hypothetical protein LJE56_00135 [Acidiferrobacterales bacterium]|nr:hypothetical protein [Acidiferrobacterales bacterium]